LGLVCNNRRGLDLISVSGFIINEKMEELVRGASKTALGIRPFDSLKRKNSEHKILLVQSFGELKGDLTGSSNSKSFGIEKIQEMIRNNATITMIQHASSYNGEIRLDPPIPSGSNTL
jgi:hypothetical protein